MRKKYAAMILTAVLSCGAFGLTAGAASADKAVTGEETEDFENVDFSAEPEYADIEEDGSVKKSSGDAESEASSEQSEQTPGRKRGKKSASSEGQTDESKNDRKGSKSVGTVTEVSKDSITIRLQSGKHHRKDSSDSDASDSTEKTCIITSDTLVVKGNRRIQSDDQDQEIFSVSEIKVDDRVKVYFDEDGNAAWICILDETKMKDADHVGTEDDETASSDQVNDVSSATEATGSGSQRRKAPDGSGSGSDPSGAHGGSKRHSRKAPEMPEKGKKGDSTSRGKSRESSDPDDGKAPDGYGRAKNGGSRSRGEHRDSSRMGRGESRSFSGKPGFEQSDGTNQPVGSMSI